MRSLNLVQLIGNLGGDPEMRYTPNGKAVTTFNLATNMVWKDDAGKEQERTEWHRVLTWEKTAEIVNEHLNKGSCVYVSGRLQTRMWTDAKGVDRWTTEVVASQVMFLDKKNDRRPDAPVPDTKVPVGGGPEPAPVSLVEAVEQLVTDGKATKVSDGTWEGADRPQWQGD